jgi:hypothetical protein
VNISDAALKKKIKKRGRLNPHGLVHLDFPEELSVLHHVGLARPRAGGHGVVHVDPAAVTIFLNRKKQEPGLPAGLFSYQKSQLGYILEVLIMQNDCILHDHLE